MLDWSRKRLTRDSSMPFLSNTGPRTSLVTNQQRGSYGSNSSSPLHVPPPLPPSPPPPPPSPQSFLFHCRYDFCVDVHIEIELEAEALLTGVLQGEQHTVSSHRWGCSTSGWCCVQTDPQGGSFSLLCLTKTRRCLGDTTLLHHRCRGLPSCYTTLITAKSQPSDKRG